jgi:hypothetical protein
MRVVNKRGRTLHWGVKLQHLSTVLGMGCAVKERQDMVASMMCYQTSVDPLKYGEDSSHYSLNKSGPDIGRSADGKLNLVPNCISPTEQ